MHPVLQQILQNLGGRVDAELLPKLYEAAGRATPEIRHELQEAGLAYWDPATGRRPEPAELEASASALVAAATRGATASGAVAGFAGALALPPELVAALVQTLRLGQRLAVVYGHDPETDRGRLLLWRAVAAAWEVDLPRQSAVDLRLSALPALLTSQLPTQGRAELARTLVARAAVSLGRRTLGLLPGVGAGLGAIEARRRVRGHGARMRAVFARAWDGDVSLDGPIAEAIEVHPARDPLDLTHKKR